MNAPWMCIQPSRVCTAPFFCTSSAPSRSADWIASCMSSRKRSVHNKTKHQYIVLILISLSASGPRRVRSQRLAHARAQQQESRKA